MIDITNYPNKIYHPGVFIKDDLEALNMTSKEFSVRTNISERTLSALINGKGNITFDIATKLANYFHQSPETWMNLQIMYDQYRFKKQFEKEIKNDYHFIKPYLSFFEDNHIINKNDNQKTVVEKIRNELNVNQLTSLKTSKDAFVCFSQNDNDIESDYVAKNIWVTYSLAKARQNMEVASYKRNALLKELQNIKTLIVEQPQNLLNHLTNILSKCGVIFVFLPPLHESRLLGLTKWLNKNVVVVAMTSFTKTADEFWFTFFHEISHVLMEHKRYFLLLDSLQEDEEAITIQERLLFPYEAWLSFAMKQKYDAKNIAEFAEQINILPCLVTRLLKRYGLIDDKSVLIDEISYKEYLDN